MATMLAWAGAAMAQLQGGGAASALKPVRTPPQEPGAQRLVLAYKPTSADDLKAFPNGPPVSGYVNYRCVVAADGGVVGCMVQQELPPGQGLAAGGLTAIGAYRFDPVGKDGKPVEGQRVLLGRYFVKPGDETPDWLIQAQADKSPEQLRLAAGDKEPGWLMKPSYSSLAATYPPRALSDGIEGSATLNCRVTVEGFLDRCKALKETPEGIGFGGAAIALSAQFAMTPKIRGGKAVEGEVTIPINWGGLRDTINPGRAAHPLYSAAPWLTAPTVAQVTAAYPAKAQGAAGQALMRCEVSSEFKPIRCQLKSEIPANRGFGAAAKTLLPAFVVAVPADGSMRVKDAMLDISFRFHSPEVGVTRPLYDVQWSRNVSATEAEALFPKASRDAGLKAGAAEIECLAAAEGRLTDCRASLGDFGAAALEAARILRINPWTRAGEAVEGRRVAMLMDFRLDPPSVTPTVP